MKKTISIGFAIVSLVMLMDAYGSVLPGHFYLGIGGGWNTITESFDSELISSQLKSGRDHYDANNSRLAPLLQIGYWAPINPAWVLGVSAQWKYLEYKTENDHSSRGQLIPNATFSSINFFGPSVIRDFSSQTRVNNEVLLLPFLGLQLKNGYAYLGLGPALLTVSNSIYVSSIHTPNGVGDHLTSGSVSNAQLVWAGAIQAGYNYFLAPTIFLNFNYSYLYSGTNDFNNSINAAKLNGFNVPGPAVLNLNRSIKLNIQEFMFSINKVFC